MIDLDADSEMKEGQGRARQGAGITAPGAPTAEARRKRDLPPEERLAFGKGTRLASLIARAALVAWAFYFFIPQFAATWMLEAHGTGRAYTAFYWLVNGFLFAIALLVAWKYYHPLSFFGFVPVVAACGYSMTRFFVEGPIFLNLPGVLASGTFVGLMLFNVVFQVFLLVRNIAKGRFVECIAALPRSKVFKVALVASVAWAGTTAWSYLGFGQVYTVRDFHQPSFSVSFWGWPSMGSNIAAYRTPDGIAEMQRYAELNSSFYFTIQLNTFLGDMTPYERILNEWAPYNVSAIFNIDPYSDPANASTGDFCTYYHVQQMNDSINAMMDWMATVNDTVRGVIRGLSFDVEGPNYLPLSGYPISREQYDLAVRSYQGILDEFQQNTSCSTHLISMSGILFDAMDGADDHDLDVAQRTVSTELNWTQYGFMTYMIDAHPAASQYEFVQHCQVGVEQWGADFVPWVGWWYDVDPGETPQIELPGVYEQTMEQVKIAKSSGVPEVVLAPVRNFLGIDHNATKIQQRLGDLVAIKAGFETFTIRITNNLRILFDWDLYWRKIVPYYIWSSENVVLDMLMGTPGEWLAILQGIFIGVVAAVTVYRGRKVLA
ncbi:MAG: hypothetical protein JW839_15720 [Candidatus Lokiarchaeota archaeon]|nr:hypothetical protein [Candidatus Lokiarchaeota archaeon]